MEVLYKYRFEIFFVTLLGILLGTVIFAYHLFEMLFQPLLFLLNIAKANTKLFNYEENTHLVYHRGIGRFFIWI